ncbi:MAG TPA: LysR family transcriptional regulator [Gaiellaceae bacterium]|nr:LysR family transcriptional regulator [Gaiellaceae bacterium]
MTLRQLECFLAIAAERSFTRAAARIGIAQPSLSQQIRALEAEVGGALLERLPRGAALTPAGRALLPEARSAVEAAERGARGARTALGLESGEIEIATVRSIAVGILPAALRLWNARHPEVMLRLHEHSNRRNLEESVRRGNGDVAVGPRPVDWAGPVEPLGYEQFVVVVAPSDAIADRGTIRLEELAERRWVLFEAEFGLNEIVMGACARAGFQPRAAVRTSQSEAAARLAAAGLGPALVPDNILPAAFEGAILHLEPPVRRELVAYARTEWTQAAASLVELIRSSAILSPA